MPGCKEAEWHSLELHGKPVQGCDTLGMTPRAAPEPQAHVLLSFLSFPSRALLWGDAQNLKNMQGMWHLAVLSAHSAQLGWAQAWDRQGFRWEIGAERLHFEGEVGCMTPARALSFHCWKTLKIPFGDLGPSIFPLSPSVSPSGKRN